MKAGVPFGVLPAFLFFAASALANPSRKTSRPRSVAPPLAREIGRVWAESLDFVLEEGDLDGLEILRARIVKDRPDDFDLITKLLAVEVRKKDRPSLLRQVVLVRDANHCLSERPGSICGSLEKLWEESLSTLLFFEESAAKFEKVRRLLETRDCASALPVLKEVAAREDPLLRTYLERLVQVQECLGDVPGKTATEARLKELKVFDSDS